MGKVFLQGADSGGPFVCVMPAKYMELDADDTILLHFTEQKLHLI